MTPDLFFRGRIILPDRIERGAVLVRGGLIHDVFGESMRAPAGAMVVDAGEGFVAPGFVDLHVHGGAGADFMDGTAEAFSKALRCHARHGTTRLAATTTVARHEPIMEALSTTRRFRRSPEPNGSRVLGAHFYGPYFRYEARGAHPGEPVRPPVEAEFAEYLQFADDLVTATIAPEVGGAEAFALACRANGVRTNVGHSWATFDQMTAAVDWGVRHVDHLFCAMSDRARLRQFQNRPMRGGVMEATLYYDGLTTEVIADGEHLDAGLLLLAWKIKGPDRLALVTDSSRALDMPDGLYVLGPLDGGEPILKRGEAGLTPDAAGLASSVMGMDHMVRTFARLTGRPLWETVRMASLTPARIAGGDREFGSLEPGKRADVLVLDEDLHVSRVFIDGGEIEVSHQPPTLNTLP